MSSQEFVFDPAAIQQIIRSGIPHCGELGIDVAEIGDKTFTLSLPYQERLIGNPETGVLHGGVITTLIDTVCGMAVYLALKKYVPIATLDLRIDYLRPATPKKTLFAQAECYKLTRRIAFVKSVAYNDDIDDPVASCAAAFMIDSSKTPPLNHVAKHAAGKTGEPT